MEMEITFPGGKRVFADWAGFTIETDQPVHGGGDGTAPSPFDLFLASIGTCAGIFALGFMQQRGIKPDGSRIVMKMEYDNLNRRISGIDLNLVLPKHFPHQYREAIVRAMDLCTVKKHMATPPEFTIGTTATPA